MEKFIITKQQLEKIANTVAQYPYAQVHQIIELLQSLPKQEDKEDQKGDS